MHDIMEGVIPWTLKYTIINIVEHNYSTITSMNNKLKEINFPHNSNIPKILNLNILKDGLISGSASQKLELFVVFPRLINTNILINNESYNIYLILRDIVDYIYSPVIEKESLVYLSNLISTFLVKIKEIHPIKIFKLKFHFMLNIPYYIQLYGSLRNIYCFNFEKKHQWFKKMSKVTQNFINISHTLSIRHQMMTAKNNISNDFLEKEVNFVKKSKLFNLNKFSLECRNCIINLTDESIIKITTNIIIDGLKYSIDENIVYVLYWHKIIFLFFLIY